MKSKSSVRMPSNKNTQQSNVTTGAVGGALAGGALSNATSMSSPILMSCPPEDTTFMCRLTRFYNSFKMIIGIIVIIVLIALVIWFATLYFKNRRR
jgi:hypothetical protein